MLCHLIILQSCLFQILFVYFYCAFFILSGLLFAAPTTVQVITEEPEEDDSSYASFEGATGGDEVSPVFIIRI